MKYSPTTRGFYDPIINKNIPVDSVDISQKQYRDLLDGESFSESEIVPNPVSGIPELKKKDFDLEAYKIQAINRIYDVSEKFIRKYCHPWIMETAMWTMVSKGSYSQSSKLVLDWVWTVRNDSISKQDIIRESKDKATIDSNFINMEYLESKYGENGNITSAPSGKLNQFKTT